MTLYCHRQVANKLSRIPIRDTSSSVCKKNKKASSDVTMRVDDIVTQVSLYHVELYRRALFISVNTVSSHFNRRHLPVPKGDTCKGNCMRWGCIKDSRTRGRDKAPRAATPGYADIGAWRAHNAHGQLFPRYRAKDSWRKSGKGNEREKTSGKANAKNVCL